MGKILITGNGFDIALGLPTRYNDFIKIMKSLLNKTNDNPYCELNNYLKHQNKYDEAYGKIQQKDGLTELISDAKENSWLEYFLNEDTFENWVDFEREILEIITDLESFINTLNQIIKATVKRQTNEFELTNGLTSLTKKILKNFKLGEVKQPLRKNLTLHVFNDYLKKSDEVTYSINQEKIYSFIHKELKSFKVIFAKYIDLFVVPLIGELDYIDLNFSDIDYHYTFNYTPSFNEIVKDNTQEKDVAETKYLHGFYKNKIVLGVDKIDNNKQLIPFTKYFQRLNYTTDYKFLEEINKEHSTYKIFIFGHSLDASDRNFIEEIFQFRKDTDSEILVIYHNDASRHNILVNLLDIFPESHIYGLMRYQKLKLLQYEDSVLHEKLKPIDIEELYLD